MKRPVPEVSGATPALLVSLDAALFDLRPARAAALAEALADYTAIAGARPAPPTLTADLDPDVGHIDRVVDLGVAVLRSLAAGSRYPPRPHTAIAPAAAVDRGVLERLYAESWLGSALAAALAERSPRVPEHIGRIHDARPEPAEVALLSAARAASRPIAIISALPAPEALFLLGTHGLTAIADQVVATDLGQPPRSPLQRIAAAVERLGVASAELCSNAAADHEALDAYMSSRIARLSNFV